jgi:hypothetical protein
MSSGYTLASWMLTPLCLKYNGRGDLTAARLVEEDLDQAMRAQSRNEKYTLAFVDYRNLEQKHLLEIAALSGLPRVFRFLLLYLGFSVNLAEISLCALKGGNSEIIRLCCEQEGHRFPGCIGAAYATSGIKVLHWLLQCYPDCAPRYKDIDPDVFIRDFFVRFTSKSRHGFKNSFSFCIYELLLRWKSSLFFRSSFRFLLCCQEKYISGAGVFLGNEDITP